MRNENEWRVDPTTEQKLREFGLQWKIVTIKLAEIDDNGSRQNHARLRGTDDEVVELYSLALSRGDIFPMITVREGSNGYLIYNGNHTRLAAEKIGMKTIGAYLVLNATKEHDDLIPRAMNLAHGTRSPKSEALANALHAVTSWKYSTQQAAEKYGLSSNLVCEELRNKEIRQLLESRKIKTNHIAKTTLLKLNPIPLESVRIEAGKLLCNANLGPDETKLLVKEIRSKPDESKMLEVIAEWDSRLDAGSKKKTTTTNHIRELRRFIHLGETVLNGKKRLQQFGANEKDFQELPPRCRSLAQKLNGLSTT